MANRLAELETYLGSRPKPARGRTRKAGARPAGYAASIRAPRPRALAAPVDYRVPGIVPALAQPSGMTCWATVATMMLSWKRNQSMTIDTALGQLGGPWLQKFRANQGLGAADKPRFLAAVGLLSQPPMNPSIDGWASMLRRYGPLWVTTDEAPGDDNWAIHARVMRGIHGDGTPDGTQVDIVDPAGGREYRESFSRFQAKFEEEASVMVRRRDPSPFRVQIVHWPAETGISLQLALRAAQAVGPTAASIPVVGLGIAVFNTGRTIATQGDLSMSSAEASHIFPNTPPDAQRTRSTMELRVEAHHPRYGVSNPNFYFEVQVEHNGHDILLSRVSLLRNKSSTLHLSSFDINFRPVAGTTTDGKATIRYLIDGRWDPFGTGDVSFRGEMLLRPDGSAEARITSDRNWVSPKGFENVRREPLPTPRRHVDAHELFFDPPGSDRIQPGTERTLLDWFDALPQDVRQRVRNGTTPAVLHGHASTTGADDRNRELARRRAQRVETILRDHLGPSARLEIVAHGERGAGPDGVEDRARRKVRVEITSFR